jgi:hypothetical protein
MDPEEKAYVALWAANAKGRQGSAQMNCTEKNWYKQMDRVRKKVYARHKCRRDRLKLFVDRKNEV